LALVVEQHGKRHVEIDGQSGPGYDRIETLIFSSDSKHIAYKALKGIKHVVAVDGQTGPEYDLILDGGPTLHSDGRFEYLALRDDVFYRITYEP